MRPLTLILRPFAELMHGLDRVLEANGLLGLARTLIGLLVGFWIYVPLHELGHAFACLLAGGTVSELEISPLYGGAILAQWIPWVTAGGEYAGRLSGFDTGGRDWIYLATDFGPFLLTLPGVWMLRFAARRADSFKPFPALPAFLFGAALSFAMAPFLSLTGDAYEIGSILTTQLLPWSEPTLSNLLRGDDLGKRLAQLRASPAPPWIGFFLASSLGVAWAFVTYWLADAVAARLGQKPLAPLVLR